MSRSENEPPSPPWPGAAQTSTHRHTLFPRDSAATCFIQQRTKCDKGIRSRCEISNLWARSINAVLDTCPQSRLAGSLSMRDER